MSVEGMNQSNVPLSEEERARIAQIEKERALSDAELIKDGAEYVVDENGEKRLEVTDEQLHFFISAFDNLNKMKNKKLIKSEYLAQLNSIEERKIEFLESNREHHQWRQKFFYNEVFNLTFPYFTLEDLEEISYLYKKSEQGGDSVWFSPESQAFKKMAKTFEDVAAYSMPDDKIVEDIKKRLVASPKKKSLLKELRRYSYVFSVDSCDYQQANEQLCRRCVLAGIDINRVETRIAEIKALQKI